MQNPTMMSYNQMPPMGMTAMPPAGHAVAPPTSARTEQPAEKSAPVVNVKIVNTNEKKEDDASNAMKEQIE